MEELAASFIRVKRNNFGKKDNAEQAEGRELNGCTRRSLAESDDTRGCICTICIVDLLMVCGLRSKHVEEFNFM